MVILPGYDPGLEDSNSSVLPNYTTGPSRTLYNKDHNKQNNQDAGVTQHPV